MQQMISTQILYNYMFTTSHTCLINCYGFDTLYTVRNKSYTCDNTLSWAVIDG